MVDGTTKSYEPVELELIELGKECDPPDDAIDTGKNERTELRKLTSSSPPKKISVRFSQKISCDTGESPQ